MILPAQIWEHPPRESRPRAVDSRFVTDARTDPSRRVDGRVPAPVLTGTENSLGPALDTRHAISDILLAMRVLIVTNFIDRSERAVYQALPGAGHAAEVICTAQARGQKELAAAGVDVTNLTVRHRLDLPAMRQVRSRIRAFEPEVIYAPGNKTLSVTLMAARGTGARVIGYRGTIGHLSHWDPASWLTYLNSRLSRIVCVSEAVRRYLLSLNIPTERAVTIYKGHDPAWYQAFEKPDLASFGIPADAFVVGFTGSMRPVKGVDVLLDALHRVPADLPVHLLLVGEVRDKRIADMADDPAIRDRVHLTGFRTDAPALAGACSAFAMPTVEREGLPRSVIEAMCQRVAPSVTDVGGMTELVESGTSGTVVPPRNARALAAAIEQLARDPQLCRSMGEGAARRIATDFHIDTTVRRMHELFTDAAAP